ncbi:MAG: hypothetical protein AB2L07_11370 [Thermoanaerobaculaceae bacterium]
MTAHRRSVTLHSLLSAVCLAALAAGPASAQTAPCPEGGAPTSVCTFVDLTTSYCLAGGRAGTPWAAIRVGAGRHDRAT